MAGVRVVWDQQALAALERDPVLLRNLEASVAPLVRDTRAAAPKATGVGAASIRAELAPGVDAAWEVRVGWDQLRYYMGFHELGTRYLPADPFLRPALDQYARGGGAGG